MRRGFTTPFVPVASAILFVIIASCAFPRPALATIHPWSSAMFGCVTNYAHLDAFVPLAVTNGIVIQNVTEGVDPQYVAPVSRVGANGFDLNVTCSLRAVMMNGTAGSIVPDPDGVSGVPAAEPFNFEPRVTNLFWPNGDSTPKQCEWDVVDDLFAEAGSVRYEVVLHAADAATEALVAGDNEATCGPVRDIHVHPIALWDDDVVAQCRDADSPESHVSGYGSLGSSTQSATLRASFFAIEAKNSPIMVTRIYVAYSGGNRDFDLWVRRDGVLDPSNSNVNDGKIIPITNLQGINAFEPLPAISETITAGNRVTFILTQSAGAPQLEIDNVVALGNEFKSDSNIKFISGFSSISDYTGSPVSHDQDGFPRIKVDYTILSGAGTAGNIALVAPYASLPVPTLFGTPSNPLPSGAVFAHYHSEDYVHTSAKCGFVAPTDGAVAALGAEVAIQAITTGFTVAPTLMDFAPSESSPASGTPTSVVHCGVDVSVGAPPGVEARFLTFLEQPSIVTNVTTNVYCTRPAPVTLVGPDHESLLCPSAATHAVGYGYRGADKLYSPTIPGADGSAGGLSSLRFELHAHVRLEILAIRFPVQDDVPMTLRWGPSHESGYATVPNVGTYNYDENTGIGASEPAFAPNPLVVKAGEKVTLLLTDASGRMRCERSNGASYGDLFENNGDFSVTYADDNGGMELIPCAHIDYRLAYAAPDVPAAVMSSADATAASFASRPGTLPRKTTSFALPNFGGVFKMTFPLSNTFPFYTRLDPTDPGSSGNYVCAAHVTTGVTAALTAGPTAAAQTVPAPGANMPLTGPPACEVDVDGALLGSVSGAQVGVFAVPEARDTSCADPQAARATVTARDPDTDDWFTCASERFQTLRGDGAQSQRLTVGPISTGGTTITDSTGSFTIHAKTDVVIRAIRVPCTLSGAQVVGAIGLGTGDGMHLIMTNQIGTNVAVTCNGYTSGSGLPLLSSSINLPIPLVIPRGGAAMIVIDGLPMMWWRYPSNKPSGSNMGENGNLIFVAGGTLNSAKSYFPEILEVIYDVASEATLAATLPLPPISTRILTNEKFGLAISQNRPRMRMGIEAHIGMRLLGLRVPCRSGGTRSFDVHLGSDGPMGTAIASTIASGISIQCKSHNSEGDQLSDPLMLPTPLVIPRGEKIALEVSCGGPSDLETDTISKPEFYYAERYDFSLTPAYHSGSRDFFHPHFEFIYEPTAAVNGTESRHGSASIDTSVTTPVLHVTESSGDLVIPVAVGTHAVPETPFLHDPTRVVTGPFEYRCVLRHINTTASDAYVPATSAIVTVDPNGPAANCVVRIVDDTEAEAAEAVRLYLLPVDTVSDCVEVDPGNSKLMSLDIIIAKSDTSVSFGSPTYATAEGSPSVTLDVGRVSNSGAITVNVSLTGITATGGGVDFGSGTQVVTLADGEYVKTLNVPIVDDSLAEAAETFVATLEALVDPLGIMTIGGNVSATVTIAASDPFSVAWPSSTASVAEANGTADLIITRTGGMGAFTVDIDLLTTGNATAPADFDSTNVIVAFSEYATLAYVSIPIVDDSAAEVDETFVARISGLPSDPSGQGSIPAGAAADATVTILDDDVFTVAMRVATMNVVEGSDPVATIYVDRIPATVTGAFQVDVVLTDGTATGGGTDFSLATAATLSFAPTDTSLHANVTIVNDAFLEASEHFAVSLTNLVDVSGRGTITGSPLNITNVTITDDDSPGFNVRFASGAVSLPAEDGSPATVRIERVPAGKPGAFDVNVTFTDGTATGVLDYDDRTITVAFGTSVPFVDVPIPVAEDNLAEASETFTAVLSAVFNDAGLATIAGTTSAVVTINDDDVFSVSFNEASYTFGEGVGTATLGLVRTGALGTFSVDVVLGSVTATGSGVDFTDSTITVNFGTSDLTASASVPIAEDALVEPDETFSAALGNLVTASPSCTIAGNTSVTVTIIDNDVAFVPLEVQSDLGAVYSVYADQPLVVNVTAAQGVFNASLAYNCVPDPASGVAAAPLVPGPGGAWALCSLTHATGSRTLGAVAVNVTVVDGSTTPVVISPPVSPHVFAVRFDQRYATLSPTTAGVGAAISASVSGFGFLAGSTYRCNLTYTNATVSTTVLSATVTAASTTSVVCPFSSTETFVMGEQRTQLTLEESIASVWTPVPDSTGPEYIDFFYSLPLAPGPPAASTATYPTTSTVAVTWPTVTISVLGGLPILSYTVYRDGAVLGTVMGLSFTDTTALPNTAYAYSLAITTAKGTGPQSSTTTVTTPAAAPSLTSLTPSVVPAAGGATVTLAGQSFGTGAADVTHVTVDGVNATVTARTSDTAVEVLVPGPHAVGTASVVLHTVHGVSGPLTLTFAPAPNVTLVSPATSGRVEQVVVGISGVGLGSSLAEVTAVSLAGIGCNPFVWRNSQHIDCTAGVAPAGVATAGPASVTTTTGGVGTSVSTFVYTYPVVSAVEPLTGPLAGGNSLTLHGTHLGLRPTGDLLSVNLTDGSACLSPARIDATRVVCTVSTAAPVAGARVAGTPYGVTVETASGGISVPLAGAAAAAASYTFAAPGNGTTPGSSPSPTAPVVAPFPVGVFPASGPLAGGTPITITGSGLGVSAADVVSVMVGTIPCTSVVYEPLTPPALSCVTGPSGTTQSLPVIVTTISGGASDPSTPGTGKFTYADAALKIPVVTRVDPLSGVSTGAYMVTISGIDFGAVPADVANVTFGALAATSFTYLSSSAIHAVVPANTPGPTAVTVVPRSGGATVPGSFRYVYPKPILTNALPRVVKAEGGTTVTIRGLFFNPTPPASLEILIAGQPCMAPTWISEELVSCITPPQPMTGLIIDVPLVVVVNGQSSGEVTLAALTGTKGFRYAAIECDVSSCDWNSECNESTGSCGACVAGYTKPPGCIVEMLVLRAANPGAGPLQVAETPVASVVENGELHFFLRDAIPSAVTFEFGPEDPATSDAVEVTPSKVTVEPGGTFDTVRVLKVTAVQDNVRDGNRTVNIVARAVSGSGPLMESKVVPSVTVATLDAFPSLTSMSPTVVPLIGANVTFSGEQWDDWVEVLVEGKSVGQFKVDRPGGGVGGGGAAVLRNRNRNRNRNRDGERLSAAQVGGVGTGSGTVRVPVPSTVLRDEGGYHLVTVVNVFSGTRGSNDKLLYTTDDCPEEGQYGTGKTCKDCPDGAVCPGGNRIWPLAGYWNPSETSGYIQACTPPSACLGGRQDGGLCSTGYEGEMCGKCTDEFYRSNGVCNPCPDSGSTIIFIVGDVVVWVGFALASVLIRDRMTLSYVVMTVRALQMLSGVGSMTEGENIPGWVLTIYSVLHIFSGDYSFIKPDCVTPIPFEVTFAVSIAYNIAVFVPVFLFIGLASVIAPGKAEYADISTPGLTTDHEGNALAGGATRGKYFWSDRMVRMLVIWGAVMYLSLTSLGFETLACTPNAIGEYRMITRPHERCFVGNHVIVTAAACVILIFYTIGFPLLMLRWVKKEENFPLLHLDERFMERWNFLYEFYNDKNPTFWLIEFPITCIVAAGKSLLKPHVNYQMSISVAVFAYKLIYIIVRRPFIDWLTDVIQAILALVSMIAINMTFFDKHGVFDKIPAMSTSMAIAIVVIFTIAIAGMLGMIVYLLTQPAGKAEEERKQKACRKSGLGIGGGPGGEDGGIEGVDFEFDPFAGDEGISPLGPGDAAEWGEDGEDEGFVSNLITSMGGFFDNILSATGFTGAEEGGEDGIADGENGDGNGGGMVEGGEELYAVAGIGGDAPPPIGAGEGGGQQQPGTPVQ